MHSIDDVMDPDFCVGLFGNLKDYAVALIIKDREMLPTKNGYTTTSIYEIACSNYQTRLAVEGIVQGLEERYCGWLDRKDELYVYRPFRWSPEDDVLRSYIPADINVDRAFVGLLQKEFEKHFKAVAISHRNA